MIGAATGGALALAKIKSALAALFTAKKAAAAVGASKVIGKTAASQAAKNIAAETAKRGFLGKTLGATKKFTGDALTSYLGGKPTIRNIGENFFLDGVFGTMAGLNEPGDLGDKLTRGLTVAGAGALGGMGTTTAYGKVFNKGKMPTGLTRQMTEIGGNIVGDTAGMSLADSIQRLKNGGMTAWEKEAQKQDELYRQQLEQEFLQKYRMLGQQPQVAYGNDPFLVENGLA